MLVLDGLIGSHEYRKCDFNTVCAGDLCSISVLDASYDVGDLGATWSCRLMCGSDPCRLEIRADSRLMLRGAYPVYRDIKKNCGLL